MIKIAPIVEGDGEVAALPVLLRRLGEYLTPNALINALQPIRVRRDRFLNRDEEFRRQLYLADAKSGDDGWVLILLDADDDCPASLGRNIYEKAREYIPQKKLSVVLANREYEAWFIASSEALEGHRGFSCVGKPNVLAEVPRDAKGWMRERMSGGKYSPILDQPSFSAKIDIELARKNSRSFQKLCSEWVKNI